MSEKPDVVSPVDYEIDDELSEHNLSTSLASIDEQIEQLESSLRRSSIGSVRGIGREKASSSGGYSNLDFGLGSRSGISSISSKKPRQPPTPERVQAAIQLIKANSHTPHPSSHSLLWTEDRIVIELGSLYVKFGFSSHPTPQFILPVYSPTLLPALEYVEKHNGFYIPELESLMTELGGEFMFEDKIFHLLSTMFRTYLSQAPFRRRLILLENPYFPLKLKTLFSKVLFERFQVAALTFLPTQLASLMSTGESSGLVIDVGNFETTVLPIYFGCPMYSAVVSSPLAGKSLNQHLKKLLLTYAHIQPSKRIGPLPHRARTPRPISMVSDPQEVTLTPAMISLSLLEEIKMRFLLVSSALSDQPISLTDPDFEERNIASSQATSVVFPFRYQGKGYDLVIPGWIREHAYDFLFDPSADLDGLTPPQAALECLSRVPQDIRACLTERLLLTGGCSEALNFSYRFQIEFLQLLSSHPRYKKLRSLGDRLKLLNNVIFSPVHNAWAGTVVACKMRGVSEQISSDKFDASKIPDWSLNLATQV